MTHVTEEDFKRIYEEMHSTNITALPRGLEKVSYDEFGRKKSVCYSNGVEFPIVYFEDMQRERAESATASAAGERKRHRECFSDGFKAYGNAHFNSLANGFDTNAVAVTRSYVESFEQTGAAGGGLLLYGGPGVGKTHLAACACNALLVRHRCKMTTLQALEDDHYRIAAGLRRLLEYDLVVIDDFGTERTTEMGRSNTFTVFNRLVGDGRPFIVTTCLDPEKTMRLDKSRERVMGRIFQCCKLVEVSGPDRRLARMPAQMAD